MTAPVSPGGTTPRHDLVVLGVTAAIVALAASALLHPAALVVVAAGLVLSAAYSLRPVRVADRGAAASLLLPAGYVAVPYLVGVLGARGSVIAGDLALLGGLYVGFIGRIVLKDFRDVRGDALFGKRTFLVRYGRRRTCAFSAACWIAGTATLATVREPTSILVAAWAGYLAVALWLLRALSAGRGRRRDEALISAIAIVGRGMIVTLLAHYSMTAAGWSALAYLGVMSAVITITIGQACMMARCGPITTAVVPSDWVATPTRPVGKEMDDWCAAHIASLETVSCGQAGHHAPEDRPEEIAAAVPAWTDRHRLRQRSDELT